MKGNSGMGMRKHGKSGRSGKSPKLRLAMRREAEKDERRPKKYPMALALALINALCRSQRNRRPAPRIRWQRNRRFLQNSRQACLNVAPDTVAPDWSSTSRRDSGLSLL